MLARTFGEPFDEVAIDTPENPKARLNAGPLQRGQEMQAAATPFTRCGVGRRVAMVLGHVARSPPPGAGLHASSRAERTRWSNVPTCGTVNRRGRICDSASVLVLTAEGRRTSERRQKSRDRGCLADSTRMTSRESELVEAPPHRGAVAKVG